MGLYRDILGDRYLLLPATVQRLHEPEPRWQASGRCAVERGTGLLARFVGALMRFPAASEDLPLRFEIEAREGREFWRRQFGNSRLQSVFRVQDGRLRETMGPLCLEQSLEPRPDGLHLIPLRAWFLGVPLPSALVPWTRAVAREESGRYCFDVAAGLPFVGQVVRYRGWLQIDEG